MTGLETYPFVRLAEAKRRLLAARRRPDRLRHRRAARGDAGLHPRGARRGARAALHLPAGRGLPELRAAVAGWAQRRFGAALDPDTQVLPTLGSKEAIFHLAQVLGGEPRRRPGARLPGLRARRAVRRQARARAAAARGERLPARPRRRRRRRPGATSRSCGSTTRTTRPPRPRRASLYERAAGARRASTTSSSPPTRPTRRSTSATSRPSPRSQLADLQRRRGLQHALQALLDARLPLRASWPATRS